MRTTPRRLHEVQSSRGDKPENNKVTLEEISMEEFKPGGRKSLDFNTFGREQVVEISLYARLLSLTNVNHDDGLWELLFELGIKAIEE